MKSEKDKLQSMSQSELEQYLKKKEAEQMQKAEQSTPTTIS